MISAIYYSCNAYTLSGLNSFVFLMFAILTLVLCLSQLCEKQTA